MFIVEISFEALTCLTTHTHTHTVLMNVQRREKCEQILEG